MAALPRALQVLALLVAIAVSNAPAVVYELVEHACAASCADEEEGGDCSGEGSRDCSPLCPTCPRVHVALPAVTGPVVAAAVEVTRPDWSAGHQLPSGPPLPGIFHPPRAT
jgi:hypothetical protein